MDAPFNVAKPTISGGQDVRDDPLIAIVDQLARELHPQQARSGTASLSSRLEHDLGIDSLGRTELALWLERAFGKRLPIGLIAEAETINDLHRALGQAGTQAPQMDFVPKPLPFAGDFGRHRRNHPYRCSGMARKPASGPASCNSFGG
jgi:acyl carrier protein